MGSYLDKLLLGVKQVYLSGAPLPQRPIINLVSGFTAADNPSLDSTDVVATGGSGAAGVVFVQNAGLALTTRNTINFNAPLVATDNGSFARSDVTLGVGGAGQVLITNASSSAAAWETVSGDATLTSAGVVTVTGIRGNSVPSPSGTSTVLTWTGSVLAWQAGGGGSSSSPGAIVVAAPGFLQPIVGATVSIPVNASAGANAAGDFLTITGTSVASNLYQINYAPDSTHIVATNLGGANDGPGASIPAGAAVVPDAPAFVTMGGPDIAQQTVGTAVSQTVYAISGGATIPINALTFQPQRGVLFSHAQQQQINAAYPYDYYFLTQQPGPSISNPIYGMCGRFLVDVGTPQSGARFSYIGVIGSGILCAALGPSTGNNQYGQLWLGARFPAGTYTDADPSAYALSGGAEFLTVNSFGVNPDVRIALNGLLTYHFGIDGVTLFSSGQSTFGAGVGVLSIFNRTTAPTTYTSGQALVWAESNNLVAWGGGGAQTEIIAAGPGAASINTQRLTYPRRAYALNTTATGAQSIGPLYNLNNNASVRLRYALEGRLAAGGGSCFEEGVFLVQMTGGLVATLRAMTNSVLLGAPAQYLYTTAAAPPYVSVTLTVVGSASTNIQFQISPDNATSTDWQIEITGGLI